MVARCAAALGGPPFGQAKPDVRAQASWALQALATPHDVAAALRRTADVLVACVADGCLLQLRGRRTCLQASAPAGRDGASIPSAPHGAQACAAHADVVAQARRRAGAQGAHLQVRFVLREGGTGALVLWRRRGPLTPDERWLVDVVVQACVQAVDRARQARRLRALRGLRDDFLQVAAHELRTPIAALQLQLGALSRRARHGQLPTTQAWVANKADRALGQISRLGALIDDMLQAAQADSKRLRLRLRPRRCDLRRLCEEALAHHGTEAARAGCRIDWRARGPVVGTWDAGQLWRTIGHLLANAFKYGAGRPVVVRLLPRPGYVTLIIADGGIGVRERAVPRVFGRYERDVSTRAFGGLGLGLYLAHEVVRAHGGQLDLRACAGGGTAARLRLPFVRPACAGAVGRSGIGFFGRRARGGPPLH